MVETIDNKDEIHHKFIQTDSFEFGIDSQSVSSGVIGIKGKFTIHGDLASQAIAENIDKFVLGLKYFEERLENSGYKTAKNNAPKIAGK